MAIALIAATILLTLGFAAADADADVIVYRGSTMETVRTDGTEPVVLRGGGSLRDRAAKPAATLRQPRIAAGDTLWLVDEAGRQITACSLRSAVYAGQRRIVCTTQK